MRVTDRPESDTGPSDTQDGPSAASTWFAVALILTASVVAGLVLWAAFASAA